MNFQDPLDRRLIGRSDEERSQPLPGIEPVASHYTDRVIPSSNNNSNNNDENNDDNSNSNSLNSCIGSACQ
jgi:hypothetical protein